MNIKIHHDFNEIFETIGLILLALHPELRDKSKFLENANSLNDRTSIYESFQECHEQYIKTFIENFVPSAGDSFFFEEAEGIGLIFASILPKHSDWLFNVEEMSDEEFRHEILWHWLGDRKEKNLEEIISIIEEGIESGDTTITYNAMVKLILVFQNPKKYLRMLGETISNNLPAYRKARNSIETEVAQRLVNFKAPPKEFYEKFLNLFELNLVENHDEFYPTFVNPFVLTMGQGCPTFSGLYLNEEIERGQRQKKPKDVLAKMFKMLADQNKIEILMMLKEESMYNLQIANALGISAATTNHHMKTLLSRGFVTVEKREGKVYYMLEKNQIEEIIADLEALLL